MNDHDVEFDVTSGRLTGKLIKQSLTCIWVEVVKHKQGMNIDVPINSTYYIDREEDIEGKLSKRNFVDKRARRKGTARKIINDNGVASLRYYRNSNKTYSYKESTMTRDIRDSFELKIIKRSKKKHNVAFI